MNTWREGKPTEYYRTMAGKRPQGSTIVSQKTFLVVSVAIMVLNGWTLAEDANDNKEAPKYIQYKRVAKGVSLEGGYFSNRSFFASIQYKEDTGYLNWYTEHLKEIGNSVKVHIIIHRLEGEDDGCRKVVYVSGHVSLCKSRPKEVEAYMGLLGFAESQPPPNPCPTPVGTYRLKNFRPDPSQLKDIRKGPQLIEYYFRYHGKTILSYTLEISVT